MNDILSSYSTETPSQENAVRIFEGEWSSRFPPPWNLLPAGSIPLFEDPRVIEGAHTYMLEQHGALSILAIEANTRAFLKCLIVKEVLAMNRANFLCGDFRKFLPAENAGFDVIFASGVLYHMTEPVRLLRDLARTANQVFLWTHYYDRGLIASDPGVSSHFGEVERAEFAGLAFEQVRYEYAASMDWKGFCGGSAPYSYWLTRESILSALRQFGLPHIVIGHETPNHPNGPAFTLVATR
jgi:SAM-dependent methyltransferase